MPIFAVQKTNKSILNNLKPKTTMVKTIIDGQFLTSYGRAFQYVATLLCPDKQVKKLTHITESTHNGTEISCVVTFTDGTMVSTQKHPTEGQQIVIIDNKGEIIKSIWYFSFNWKGLINICQLEEI